MKDCRSRMNDLGSQIEKKTYTYAYKIVKYEKKTKRL